MVIYFSFSDAIEVLQQCLPKTIRIIKSYLDGQKCLLSKIN